MGVDVHIPVRIIVDGAELEGDPKLLESTLQKALNNALGHSQNEIVRRAPTDIIPRINRPIVQWQGNGLWQVSQPTQDVVESQIEESINIATPDGANTQNASHRSTVTRRRWRVLVSFNFNTPVSAYIDYLNAVQTVDWDFRFIYADVLPERRIVNVWVVEVLSTLSLTELTQEVNQRYEQLNPATPGQTWVWSATPHDANVEHLASLDRTGRIRQRVRSINIINESTIRGVRDSAVLSRGARLVFTRMKLPSIPSIQSFTNDPDAFWLALRTTIFEGTDTRLRREAIALVLTLRVYRQAEQIVSDALAIDDTNKLAIRLDVLQAFRDMGPNPPYSIGLYMLKGFDNSLDHSLQQDFVQWLKLQEGRELIQFLDRTLIEADYTQQTQAARVILHLLSWANTVDAMAFAQSAQAMRTFSQRHDIFSGGALGEESLRVVISSTVEIILENIRTLETSLNAGPSPDPTRSTQLIALRGLRTQLAEYTQALPFYTMRALEIEHAKISAIMLGAFSINSQVASIHSGIVAIKDFLGSSTAQSDEVDTLLQLRDRYVSLLSNALMSANFTLELSLIDRSSTNITDTIAEFKWRRIHREFRSAIVSVLENRTLQSWQNRGNVQSPEYHLMRTEVQNEMNSLRRLFHPAPIHNSAGVRITVSAAGSNRREEMISHPRDLNHAIDTETRVMLFRIHVAMFGHVAISLILESQIAVHQMGTAGFRSQATTELQSIRAAIVHDWNQNKLQEFIDRDPQIVRAFRRIQDDIRDAIRNDIIIDLLITAVTALLTVGTSLLIRGLMIGRTVGLVRTASAVSRVRANMALTEAAVFLADAALFTGAQLASHSLIHGRDLTAGHIAGTVAQNLGFLVAIRAIGRLTRPLLQQGGFGFIKFHAATATSIASAGLLLETIRNGEWPEDIAGFYTKAIASYVVFVGVAAASRQALGTIANPIIERRLQEAIQRLDESNRTVFAKFRYSVEFGELSGREFQNLKAELRSNVQQAIALAEQSRAAGIRSRTEFESIRSHLQQLDTMISNAQFTAPASFMRLTGGQQTILALPAPATLTGLVRLGSTRIYHYRSGELSPQVNSALARYEASGYTLTRLPGGVIRVVRNATGETVFVLDPAPINLLPGAPEPLQLTQGNITRPLTTVERALSRGFIPEAELTQLNTQLDTINTQLMTILEAQFTETTTLSTLRVLSQSLPQGWTRWNYNAIRGLATLLQTQRGVPLLPVQRLFQSRSSSELAILFERYYRIADFPRADTIISENMRPSRSVELINIYHQLRIARVSLPEDLSHQGMQTLRHWSQQGLNVAQTLRAIPLPRRLSRMEAISPLRNPSIPHTTVQQEVILRHALDIRPNLSLHAGTAAEVATAIEAFGPPNGGRLRDAEVHTELIKLITHYRTLVSNFQAGQPERRNLEGKWEELNSIIAALETGGEIFSLGELRNITIQPAIIPLPRNHTLVNAPNSIVIQFDVGSTLNGGQLRVTETTTGGLSLPRALAGLDPQSGTPAGGTIDWSALNPNNHSHRKWQQIIKMRAAAHFAQQLGTTPGQTPPPLPLLILRTSHVTAPARRALEAMDFTVIIVPR